MSYTRLEMIGGVARLWLDRPEAKNRLNKAFLEEIVSQVSGLDAATTALILTAPGQDVFSAGYDIDEIPAGAPLAALHAFEADNPIEKAGAALTGLPFPTLCAVNGKLYGGAMELLLSCDIRLGAEHSEYCLPPARLGVMYEPLGLWRLLQTVGYANACEMVFTAVPVPAPRARETGLINRVLPFDQLQDTALKMAQAMARLAPLTLHNSKTALQAIQRLTAPTSAMDEQLKQLRLSCFQSEDVVEGRRAFLEKRPPVFKGK